MNGVKQSMCLYMTLDDFRELIDKLTNGRKEVCYEFGAYSLIDSEDVEEAYDEDILVAFSKYFGRTIASWHAECAECPLVWFVCADENAAVLTVEQMTEMMEQNNVVKGIVEVQVSEMISCDLEEFLDLLSERLTGSILLMGTDYKALSVKEESILFAVTGDASMILESES